MELCSTIQHSIAPKKNEAMQLKKERFNRFPYACACAVYHVEDLWAFLDKYKHVTNNLACVLWALQDADCLVTFLLAAAILGVHLIEPFLAVTYSGDVTYRKLIPVMQKLYENPRATTDMGKLLDLSKPAFNFVNESQFKLRLWPKKLPDALGLAMEQTWASKNLQTYASKVSRGMAQAMWRCVWLQGFGSREPKTSS